MNAVVSEIISYLPLGSWILISYLTLFLLWKLFNFYRDTKDKNIKFGSVEETLNKIGLDIATRFQEFSKKFDLFRNPLAEIQRFLGDEMGFIPIHPIETKKFTESLSPVKLTDTGKNLLDESGAKNVIDNNFEKLEKKIDEQNLKSAYDIQVYIQRLVFQMASKDVMLPVKNFVYKNPKYKNTELELTDIQRTMVIYLRDEYFKKHPEILNDLDK